MQLNVGTRAYQPALDGIRGIAILAVLLTHAFTVAPRFQPGPISKVLSYLLIPGWAGVDLFFVLSGFLITGILISTKRSENYFRVFYARRFLRIFPLYYFVLTATLLAGMKSDWVQSLLPSSTGRRLSYFLYLQNVPYFMNKGTLGVILGHFWSLAVEEQFYIVWPILILLISERLLPRLCALGVLLALPLRIYLVHLHPDDFRVMMMTTSRIDGLLIGSGCAAYMACWSRPVPLRWIAGMFSAGFLIIAYIALFHRHELVATSFYMPVIGVTGFALLSGALVALSQHHFEFLNKPLSNRFLRSFGKYSYGIYVYHLSLYLLSDKLAGKFGIATPLPVLSGLLYTICLIGLTYVVAKISYDAFESRLLSLKRYVEPRFKRSSIQQEEGSVAVGHS